jgi:hypothetical protein
MLYQQCSTTAVSCPFLMSLRIQDGIRKKIRSVTPRRPSGIHEKTRGGASRAIVPLKRKFHILIDSLRRLPTALGARHF